MTGCRRCQSQRIAVVTAKCDDRCSVTVGEHENHGDYVPRDMGIGGGDYIEFSWCLECGQIQDKFPRPPTALEESGDDGFDLSDAEEDEEP